MSVLPAQDQRQTWTRDISRGPSPAAAMNQSQDWPAMCRAGIYGFLSHNITSRGIRPGPLNSHRLCLLLPNCRGTRHLIRATGFPSDPAHTLPNQHRLQAFADRSHILRRLSCLSSSGGFKTIGKAFADGQNLFAGGSKND